MLLAIHLTMTGRVDRASDLTSSHQPHPIRIEARLFDGAMVEAGRVDAIIRPDGWTAPDLDRANRCGVREISPLPILTDFIDAAVHVVCHDAEETDWALRVCRRTRREGPEWIKPRHILIDTAADAALLMGRDSGPAPTLAEATAALLGAPASGLNGVLALFQHDGVQALRRAA
ncbi:hypothetical protein [Acuticoccus sediminis]|uniref:hypothetical protein n=1 Tax=Acuticoccus sediminis TaxID=2184697 RepID=UPI001CFDB867|nr:hypothetical protein [Acuticoccus sediminis]